MTPSLPRRLLAIRRVGLGLAMVLLLPACATHLADPQPTPMPPPEAAAPPAPQPALPKGPATTPEALPPTSAGLPSVPKTAVADVPTPAAAAAPAPTAYAVDTLQPDARYELDNTDDSSDLWARVRRGYGIPDLDTDLVRKWEQFYAGKPDYMGRITERGGRYLFHIVEEIERRRMPVDLALLPFIESAFNPQAMSSARASGMWQFMPATGKDFSLRQNLFRDDRRDVLASTRAALDYLQRLHGMFNDWQLALAAYNWGQGNVQRAIDRNRKAGLDTGYLSLNMPDETRNYVPKLQAVKNLVARPQQFGLSLPPLLNHPYFLSVKIERDIDVALAARLAGVSLAEFQTLNPQMNKPVILASGTPQVLLPFDNAKAFARALNTHQGALATWTAWVAPKTMRPAEAARQVGMSEGDLREVNRIPPRMLVKAGSTLLVPRTARRDTDVSPELADNATLALAPDLPPMRKVTFRAGKRGDTVAAVARRYRVSPASVAQANRTTAQGRFAAGQQVVVLVPQRARVASAPTRRVASSPKGKAQARPSAPTAKVVHRAKAKPAPVRVAEARRPRG